MPIPFCAVMPQLLPHHPGPMGSETLVQRTCSPAFQGTLSFWFWISWVLCFGGFFFLLFLLIDFCLSYLFSLKFCLLLLPLLLLSTARQPINVAGLPRSHTRGRSVAHNRTSPAGLSSTYLNEEPSLERGRHNKGGTARGRDAGEARQGRENIN